MLRELITIPIHELTRIARSEDYTLVSVPYLGSPRRHPSDSQRIVLITQVLEKQRVFLEFKKEDILHVEEAQSISSQAGETVSLVKLWIKKGSLAIELRPFRVD